MREKIVIYGASGYMGSQFQKHWPKADFLWHRRGDRMFSNADFVINCGAFICQPSVDLNKNHPEQTIWSNAIFPSLLARDCDAKNIPLMHLSTGCLYDEEREYYEGDAPLRGFDGYCGFYVGTKLLAERAVREYPKHYILRLRLPFDNVSSPRNYLNKMIQYDNVFDHVNSLTHREDFVKAAYGLWKNLAPYGTYHCVNPGQISNRDVVEKLVKKGLRTKPVSFTKPDVTGCRLSTDKLQVVGVRLRSVEEAVDDAINNWVL